MGSTGSIGSSPSEPTGPGPQPVFGPRSLGRYRLCFELASGGMGTVYLARAEGPRGFEKLVALKRIHAHLAKDPKFVDMFLDEARIAAQIHHPNVCSVIDFGDIEGSSYLTMPYILGESLQTVLRASRTSGMSQRELGYLSVRIVADACEGLHAAHELRDERGELLEVVHRDVSPHNLMVGYDGGVRVLDFGVASARHRYHSTATGEVKGKFAYIAPEQLDGQRVDRRADIWSLGVILWEAVAFKRLFNRPTVAETVKAVLRDPIPSLSELAPDVGQRVEAIARRALSREPSERYATAREMGRALLEVLGEERRVIGPAELAEHMERLLPEGASDKRRLIEQARADEALQALIEDSAYTSPELAVTAEAGSASGVVDVRGGPTGTSSTGTSSREPTAQQRPSAMREGAPTPARGASGGAWKLLALVGLFVAVGAVGAAWAFATGRIAIASPEDETVGDETVGTVAPSPTSPLETPEVDPPGRPEVVATPAPTDPPGSAPTLAEPERAASDRRDSDSSNPTARPHESETARPRGTGTVAVATPGGWALVYRGDTRLGEAPGTFRLPEGRTILGIQPFGRGPIQRTSVRVRAGETERVSVAVNR